LSSHICDEIKVIRDGNWSLLMSALGQKQTFGLFIAMSALPPKADIRQRGLDVCFVPKADIWT
jgi:hypothetical protein